MSDSKKEGEIVVHLPEKDKTIIFKNELWETQIENDPTYTGYPAPLRHAEIVLEKPNQNVEEPYYYFYHQLTADWSHQIEKIVDTYAASQASSHFGHMQSRISAQQGQISQYLKGISDMIKGLFQMVRELRILDDRLSYYEDTNNPESKKKDSSEIVLKGLWVDQVEGGAKNPSSVYGLATNVGFTILPDMFFRIHLEKPDEIDDEIRRKFGGMFNEKVVELLKRKLRQYYEWKKRTHLELATRKKFMVKYVKQHYETIKLYIAWIKPYLRYVQQMQQTKKLEQSNELISSFESTIVEIEFLAKRKLEGSGDFYSVAVINLFHRTRPELNYHAQEYQHKGPTHTGKITINVRTYVWTQDQIDAYKKSKEDQDFQLLGTIDESIKEAIDALGDELKEYLFGYGEYKEPEKKAKKKPAQLGILDPFISIVKAFGEIGTMFIPTFTKTPKGKPPKDAQKLKNEEAVAKKEAILIFWLCYKNFKKSHGMMTPW